MSALVTWTGWFWLVRHFRAGLASPAGLRWFRAGCSRSFLERACHADRLVLGSSGSSRHWSRSAPVSADSARASWSPLFSSGRLVSAGSARAGWSPLVQLGPAGLRWFSSGWLVSAGSARAGWSPLVQLRPAGLRWFSSGRLVFAVCACRTPQSPGRSPSGLARSSLPPTFSVTLGPSRARIPLEFGCSRQFHTCGHS